MSAIRPAWARRMRCSRAAGVDVTLEVAPEMWHAWQLFGPSLPEAETAIQSLIAFARRRAASPLTAGG